MYSIVRVYLQEKHLTAEMFKVDSKANMSDAIDIITQQRHHCITLTLNRSQYR